MYFSTTHASSVNIEIEFSQQLQEIWLDTVMCCIWSKFLTQMSAAFANELAPSVTGLSCWSLAQVALQPCPEVSARREHCSAQRATGCRWRAATLCMVYSWKCSVVLGEQQGATAREEGGGKHSWEWEPLEMGGNSDHLSLPGLMSAIAWTSRMQLLSCEMGASSLQVLAETRSVQCQWTLLENKIMLLIAVGATQSSVLLLGFLVSFANLIIESAVPCCCLFTSLISSLGSWLFLNGSSAPTFK